MYDHLADTLHRTVKLEVESGARTLAEAEEIARSHLLQVVVGDRVAGSPTGEALLLTVLNVAPRAFIGGVSVQWLDDFTFTTRWKQGLCLRDVVADYGATAADELRDDLPTLIIGDVASDVPGKVVLHPTWNGWVAAVVKSRGARLAEEQQFPLSGVLAAGLSICEAFQHVRHDVQAGHRDVGLSLWDISVDWRHESAVGPSTYYLPEAVWLAGLGHLGQSYSWALGLLPYEDLSALTVTLQDVDRLVPANAATAVLAEAEDLPAEGSEGQRKTRLVGRRLEAIGAKTILVERLFDEHLVRQNGEPMALLAGFDSVEPRRLLEGAGFERVVDVGLGGGARSYRDMVVHSFPSQFSAAEVFASAPTERARAGDHEAYEAVLRELVEAGMTPDEAQCGIVDIVAGKSIAAAYVGAVAASLALAELLRDLYGAGRYAFIDLSLRDLPGRRTVVAQAVEPVNLGSVVSQ